MGNFRLFNPCSPCCSKTGGTGIPKQFASGGVVVDGTAIVEKFCTPPDKLCLVRPPKHLCLTERDCVPPSYLCLIRTPKHLCLEVS